MNFSVTALRNLKMMTSQQIFNYSPFKCHFLDDSTILVQFYGQVSILTYDGQKHDEVDISLQDIQHLLKRDEDADEGYNSR